MIRRSYYSTRKRRSKRRMKNRQSRKIKSRGKRAGAGRSYKTRTTRRIKTLPYSTIRSTRPTSRSILELLANCSKYSYDVRTKLENPKRRLCKFDQSCYRRNIDHLLTYKHSNENIGQTEIGAYFECTNIFLEKSWELYRSNDNQLPREWYVAISSYLQTPDYSDQHHLYFNVLANICLHGQEYVQKYSPRFIGNLLVGMEESAVTGMFDITNRPELMACLSNMNSPDDRYLSNTALLSLVKRRTDDD